jgi:hypothetical protein
MPLPFGGNSNIQGMALIPPVRDAWTLPPGAAFASAGFSYETNSHSGTVNGFKSKLDGQYFELRQDIRYGLADRIEAAGGLVSNGWSLDRRFVPPFDPSESLKGSAFSVASNLELGAKGCAWKQGESAVSGALDFKIPVLGDEDDLASSESIDVVLSTMASHRIGSAMAHAQLGYAAQGGDLDNAVFFGAGAVFPLQTTLLALGQLQWNQAVVDKVLDNAPIELLGGVRWLPRDAWSVDAALGLGLAGDSAGFQLAFKVGYVF